MVTDPHESCAFGIAGYVPRNRFNVFILADDSIVEAPLPELIACLLLVFVAGRLLQALDEADEVRVVGAALREYVEVVGHDDEREEFEVGVIRCLPQLVRGVGGDGFD